MTPVDEIHIGQLPDHFEPLFWSFRFDTLDIQKNKKTIIVQTINYGSWKQWKWLAHTYGKDEIAAALTTIPVTEFRARALVLARIVFGVVTNRTICKKPFDPPSRAVSGATQIWIASPAGSQRRKNPRG